MKEKPRELAAAGLENGLASSVAGTEGIPAMEATNWHEDRGGGCHGDIPKRHG
jgi:hypothetical protein